MLRDQANAEPSNEQKWITAGDAIADATRAFDDAGGPEIAERLAVLRNEVHAGLEAARRDRTLLEAVATVRSSKQDLRHAGADTEYTRAFREAGLDIDGDSPEEVGAKLRARPAAVNAAVAALDDWALERRAGKQPRSRWCRPLEVARAADPDPFRDRVRAALLQSDTKAQETDLVKLAKDPEAPRLPPESALLLATAIRDLKTFEPAVELLRAVTGRHPRDVWANYELAAMLQEFQPTAREEAARYYTAARALQPETGHAIAHLLLDEMGREAEGLAVFADLVELRKHDSRNWRCYGNALKERLMPEAAENLARAATEARADVRLNPDDALAHRNLAYALSYLGMLDEAVLEFREAIRLEPDDLATHVGYAGALFSQSKFEESAAVLRATIHLKADYAAAHCQLGEVLAAQNQPDAALAECREAIRLKPDVASFHVALALLLTAQQKHDQAIAEYHVAQRLNPEYPNAHCGLSPLLYELGDYAGAAAELRTGQELRSRLVGKPFTLTDAIASVDRMAALAARLPAVAKGTDSPKDADERLFFANAAYNRKLYAAAARLWNEAVNAQPSLGEDRQAQHRYNAACAAALAAAGKGVDDPAPDEAARQAAPASHCLAQRRAPSVGQVSRFGQGPG